MSALLHADWPAPPGVHAVTTLRDGPGVSPAPFDRFNFGNTGAGGDTPTNVAANRIALIDIAALPSPPRWLRQVHGTGVHREDAADAGVPRSAADGLAAVSLRRDRHRPQPTLAGLPRANEGTARSPAPGGADALPDGADGRAFASPGLAHVAEDAGALGAWPPEADASLTSTPGIVLAILTADCLPVVFASREGTEVAAAHAGWRGLAAGVLERTLAAMATPAAEVMVWLGPAAGPLAYEVGGDVYDAFVVADAGAADAFVPTRPGHWHVDLYALARKRLMATGIAAAAIHGGNRCTIREPDAFFSHRRDANTGRLATLVWMTR